MGWLWRDWVRWSIGPGVEGNRLRSEFRAWGESLECASHAGAFVAPSRARGAARVRHGVAQAKRGHSDTTAECLVLDHSRAKSPRATRGPLCQGGFLGPLLYQRRDREDFTSRIARGGELNVGKLNTDRPPPLGRYICCTEEQSLYSSPV